MIDITNAQHELGHVAVVYARDSAHDFYGHREVPSGIRAPVILKY